MESTTVDATLAMESTTEFESTAVQEDFSTFFLETPITFPTWKAIYLTIVAAMNLLCNSFAIFMICVAKRELERPDVKLVLSLFVSDLMFGLGVVVAVVGAWWPRLLYSEAFFGIYIFLTFVPGSVTVYNLGAIALVKMLSITRPLRYQVEVSSSRTKVGIVGMWTLSLVLIIPMLIGTRVRYYTSLIYALPLSTAYTMVTLVLVGIPGFTCMLFCYGKIFFAVKDTNKKIQDISVNDSETKTKNLFLKSVRSAKNLFIITATFVVVYGIGSATVLILGSNLESEYSVQFVLHWSSLPMNSSLNSVLYILLTNKMRQRALCYLLCKTPGEELFQ